MLKGSIPNCGQDLVHYLSELYREHGRHFSLGVEPSRKGVPARAVYEALNSKTHFAKDYQEVKDWLMRREVPDGSSAAELREFYAAWRSELTA